MRKPIIWFLNRSDTKRAVQPQKKARSLKFWIYEEEGFYLQSSENKGVDKLCSHHIADLRLCFCLYKLLVFT